MHQKVLVRVSQNSQGYVFRLDPRLNLANTPDKQSHRHLVEKLFIESREKPDNLTLFSSIYRQVVSLLTGLTPDELKQFDGVQFIDSIDEHLLFESKDVNVQH